MFEKGRSGNPNGRRVDPLVEKIRRKALEVCPEAIDTLIDIMRAGESKYSLHAANSLLDRGIGKVIAQKTDEDDRPATLADLRHLLAEVERNVDQPS